MDKDKREKIALFRFGMISRLLWVKEDERQHQPFLGWEGRYLTPFLFTLNWYPFYPEELQRINVRGYPSKLKMLKRMMITIIGVVGWVVQQEGKNLKKNFLST